MAADLASVLDRCLERLRAGDSIAACLQGYPEYAGDLAPLLEAAQHLVPVAGWQPPAQLWAKHQVMLRPLLDRTRAEPEVRPPRPVLRLQVSLRSFGQIALVALLLFVVLSATALAASGPGGPAYGLRLAVERVPVWFVPEGDAREVVLLRYADRRLADVQSHLVAEGHVEQAALEALLSADAEAEELAYRVGWQGRERVVSWITGHAECLRQLGESALGPRAAVTLGSASERLLRMANRLHVGLPPVP